MFEVELKFRVSAEQKEKLTGNSAFISREKVSDTYYDKEDFSLSLNDVWLRSRNEIFMLKIPLQTETHASLKIQKNTPKKEIEDIPEIRRLLGLSDTGVSFKEDLLSAGFKPLYSYDNVREKYKSGSMILDFDETVWGAHVFHMCEIEEIAENEADIPRILENIKKYAVENGLKIEYVDSRLLEIIKIQNPVHYQKLRAI